MNLLFKELLEPKKKDVVAVDINEFNYLNSKVKKNNLTSRSLNLKTQLHLMGLKKIMGKETV